MFGNDEIAQRESIVRVQVVCINEETTLEQRKDRRVLSKDCKKDTRKKRVGLNSRIT